MHLTARHLDDEADRIAKLRDGPLIVPADSPYIAHPPRDLRWLGVLPAAVIGLASASVLLRWVVL